MKSVNKKMYLLTVIVVVIALFATGKNLLISAGVSALLLVCFYVTYAKTNESVRLEQETNEKVEDMNRKIIQALARTIDAKDRYTNGHSLRVAEYSKGAAVEAVKQVDGVLFICADHGNAEQMVNFETGAPHTAHTTNPVPFILYNYGQDVKLREGGCLADIAPTLLEIMELPQPAEMTGKSLIVR